jgi:anthranilate/para-aminobenzoate synthase component II
MQATLIDFEDSFTYNIASELLSVGIEPRVVHWKNLSIEELSPLIIWGPGPGHIEEYYPSILPILKYSFSSKKYFHIGICLGHQLLAFHLGLKIKREERPTHGVRRAWTVPDWSFFPSEFKGRSIRVQGYNSWFVEVPEIAPKGVQLSLGVNGVEALKGENFVSYQFHPESAGTDSSELFFSPMKECRYN